MTHKQTRILLDNIRKHDPDLFEKIGRGVGSRMLQRVLRKLMLERVDIRNLTDIVESIADFREAAPFDALVDNARAAATGKLETSPNPAFINGKGGVDHDRKMPEL